MVVARLGFADVRMSKPVENFHKCLLEPNRGYAWKQHLNRQEKNTSKNDSLQFLYAFGIKEQSKEDYIKVGDRGRGWITG